MLRTGLFFVKRAAGFVRIWAPDQMQQAVMPRLQALQAKGQDEP